MHIIHIYTEVKRQSFNELAKATERKRHNERRRIFTRRLQKEFFRCIFRHKRNCEPFLSKILDGCSEMVNHLVYYKEAVSRLYPSVQVRKKHLSKG